MNKLLLALAVSLIYGTAAQATIMNTNVSAGMEVQYGSNPTITDNSATDSGATSASVNVTGPTTGMNAYSNLAFTSLGSQTATLNFFLGLNGNGYNGYGYLGQSSGGINFADLLYNASAGDSLNLAYNFAYTGVAPFGLSGISVTTGQYSNFLGDVGTPGSFSGTLNIGLQSGLNDIEIIFNPNVSGGVGFVNGQLAGTFNYDFTSAPVPEPGTMMLLGVGMAGLAIYGKRRKSNKA